MPKIMLINVTHSEESRVAILNDGVLEAFEIETLGREHLRGNLYKGIVRRIHPALEAAFVDIGAGRDAFLPIDEICFRNLPVSLGTDKVPEKGNGRRIRIRDVLRSGQEILVQIAKEEFGNKPPTLSTFYSLAGRCLVLLPGSDEHGISRRIEGEERQRLREQLSHLEVPEGFGVIARTAAGFDEEVSELRRDLDYLLRLWENIRRLAEQTRAPALVYREHDIVLRTIRDYLTPDIDEVYIDNDEMFERARTFAHEILPGREDIIRLYRGAQPIFSAFNVEPQIETIFKRRVPLPSGGSIVIDATEALTAIDVNSGGSVRGPNPEETAYRTNLEAAREAARQLRLRDIGGLIVIDFIDMRDAAHIHEVEQEMRRAMHADKARHEMSRISRFGLMQISRQRLRPAAAASSYTSCPMCEGHGAVRTTESAALVALRKIHNRISHGDVEALTAKVPVAVAIYLLNQKRSDLATLEQRYQTRITVQPREDLMPHQVELEVQARAVAAEAAPAPAAEAEASPAAGNDQAAKKKRRRRGGRGRKRRAAGALIAALRAIGVRAGILQPAPEAEGAHPAPPPAPEADQAAVQSEEPAAETSAAAGAAVGEPETAAPKRRRRTRRRKPAQAETPAPAAEPQAPAAETPAPAAEMQAAVTPTPTSAAPPTATAGAADTTQPEAPSAPRRTRARKAAAADATASGPDAAANAASPAPARKPRTTRTTKAATRKAASAPKSAGRKKAAGRTPKQAAGAAQPEGDEAAAETTSTAKPARRRSAGAAATKRRTTRSVASAAASADADRVAAASSSAGGPKGPGGEEAASAEKRSPRRKTTRSRATGSRSRAGRAKTAATPTATEPAS